MKPIYIVQSGDNFFVLTKPQLEDSLAGRESTALHTVIDLNIGDIVFTVSEYNIVRRKEGYKLVPDYKQHHNWWKGNDP